MASGTIKPPLTLTVNGYGCAEVDNWSISGNSYSSKDITLQGVNGRQPVGTVGADIYNASSSGSNAANCAIVRCFLLSSTTVRVNVRNIGSSAAKVHVVIYVLFANVW